MRIAVIGAGVLGASAAFHLALAGAEVVLVDQAQPGRATAAGAGIISPWTSDRLDSDWYRIAAAGARYYPELIALLAEAGETETGYRISGALQVAADAVELDRVERLARTRQAAAPEAGAVTRLSPDEARRVFPPLHPELGAIHIAGAARVDGRLLAAAFCNAAGGRGAKVLAGPAGLLARAGRIAGIMVGHEVMEADRVVVAAGAWAPTLLAPLGVDLAVWPQRGQISHLRLEGVHTSEWPVVLPPGGHYLLAFDDSRVVVGATRETGAGFDYRVTAAGQAKVLNEALTIAPGLASATLIETRIGFRPVGPGIRPMLGTVEGFAERLIVGNGLGPSGLTIGPYAGRLLAQLAIGETTDIALAPYDPFRVPAAGAADDLLVR
jgi:D-amino-acid dehydrogenase